MDGFDGGTKGYWKNRYYQRLDADDSGDVGLDPAGVAAKRPPSGRWRIKPPTSPRRTVRARPPPLPAQPSTAPAAASAPSVVRLGGRRRRRFWRIRLRPRLSFLRRVASFPARLLRGLQRGYVRMMLRFAGALGAGGAGAPEMGVGYPFPRPALKEYDEKVLVEIYRALIAQGHVVLVPDAAGAAGPGGGLTAARLVGR